MSSSASSARLPLLRNGCSRRSNSSSHHPMPTPSATRPPVSTDAVETILATVKGFRIGST